MRSRRLIREVFLPVALGLLGITVLLPGVAPAQEEVTSAIRRYKASEASTGNYGEYEVKQRRQRRLVVVPEMLRRTSLSSSYRPGRVADAGRRSRLEDSHAGLEFYEQRRCEDCHVEQAKHSHTVRGNVTCRQCHAGEPIANINYYYSPLNPTRRFAYVCAKCHEGATASFATFLIHEPNPGSTATRKTFPSLYYANWFMFVLIVGTLGFFGAHTLIWVVKEIVIGWRQRRKSVAAANGEPEDEGPGKPKND
jgi:hypothetical protein